MKAWKPREEKVQHFACIPRFIRYIVVWPSDIAKYKLEKLISFLNEEGIKHGPYDGFIKVELRGSDPATHAVFLHNINKMGFVFNQTLP